jgi:hypothetical protein
MSSMLYLCNAIKHDHSFKKKLLDLFSNYPHLPLHKLGFVGHWHKEELWL